MKHPKRVVAISAFTLFITSIVLAHRADDWTTFDHHTFHVLCISAENTLEIQTKAGATQTITLDGIVPVDATGPWLIEHVINRDITLMLATPQTRNSAGHLKAFVFLGNENLNVELVKAGLAYADRRAKTVMDGLIDPAESDARKKKRGIWYGMTDEQMPAWRKAWLRSLPGKSR
jgi:hypothetical protein